MTDLIKRFRDNEDGSAAIELVLVTPIITWALLSTIVYFDAFRAETRSARGPDHRGYVQPRSQRACCHRCGLC